MVFFFAFNSFLIHNVSHCILTFLFEKFIFKGIHTDFDIYFEQKDDFCMDFMACVCNKRADSCYSGWQTHKKLMYVHHDVRCTPRQMRQGCSNMHVYLKH